jgi:ribosomal protein S18 acetylase RimI-like enzyme
MKTNNRYFINNSSDYEKMWRLTRENYNKTGNRATWVFARLEDWKYNLYSENKRFPDFHEESAVLWFSDFGDLLGFVINEDGDSYVNIITKVGYNHLFQEILNWTIKNWAPKYSGIETNAVEDQVHEIKALKNTGFKDAGWCELSREYLLKDVTAQENSLPDGYSIVDMVENSNWESKQKLYISAFQNREELNSYDMKTMKYWMKTTSFNPYLHLSVIDKEGNHVSTCYAFTDFDNSMAEIEKVCTLKEQRNKGLAQSVIKECFNRLYKLGIKKAYITGISDEAKATYGKVGISSSKEVINFKLEI